MPVNEAFFGSGNLYLNQANALTVPSIPYCLGLLFVLLFSILSDGRLDPFCHQNFDNQLSWVLTTSEGTHNANGEFLS